MRSCNCLNILIETEVNDFQKVNQESLNLNEEEKCDSFFKQDIQKLEKLININKTHSGLIQTKIVGSWSVNRCVNCDVETHAIHREKGASCVLICSNLLNSDAITKLKNSELYSKIYNIVVNPNDVGPGDNLINTYLPTEVEQTIKNLRNVMSEVLRKETLAVEERIRQYKEQQYEILNNLRDTAYKEQQALVRVIKSTITEPINSESTKLSTSVSINEGASPRLNEPFSSETQPYENPIVATTRHTPKRQKSSPVTPSFDAECLFEFEGMDNDTSNLDSDMEESENEDNHVSDHEEGVTIIRNRAPSNMEAKSLPMNIPVFMSQTSYHDSDDPDEVLPHDPLEIGASIKALAKSVHGDAIFGDLPRPRFSTQL